MRLSAILLTVTTALLISAGGAQAVDFSFEIVSGTLEEGSDLTLDLMLDTETEDLQAWFLQVNHTGNSAVTATGVQFIISGGQIATPLGVPVVNGAAGGDATGQWAYTVGAPNALPPGSGLVNYGTITFTNVAQGDISMDISEAGGAVGGPGGVDLVAAGLVTFETITVPEPTTSVMGFLTLATLGLVRRTRRS
jgi:hypothetical protein